MIRSVLYNNKLFYKNIFYPNYKNSLHDAVEYTRVISAINTDTKNKYDCENERWVPKNTESPTATQKTHNHSGFSRFL